MSTRLKCPFCGTRMTPVQNRRLTIDWCEFCHALWFDEVELERSLLNDPGMPRYESPFEGSLKVRGPSGLSCPRCPRRPLDRVGWRTLSFVRCGGCRGTALDRPQLAGLLARYKGGEPPPSSADVAAELAHLGSGGGQVAELLWVLIQTVGKRWLL